MTNPIVAMARALRCTEGQAYTLVIGLVLAILLAVGGVPAVLRAHGTATQPATTTTTVRTGANP